MLRRVFCIVYLNIILRLFVVSNSEIKSNYIENKQNETCNPKNCPITQGACYENRCVCSYGFATLKVKDQPDINCNYQLKSRMTAFFLEFFFPIGLGHFYAEKYVLALIKFSLFLFFFSSICGELCCIKFRFHKLLICSAFAIVIDMSLWIILQFVDLVCYAFGFYKDGNGFRMI